MVLQPWVKAKVRLFATRLRFIKRSSFCEAVILILKLILLTVKPRRNLRAPSWFGGRPTT
ncbi:Hypothetical protein FKW44_010662, partial [Caligus rogercresseyi]